MNTTTGMRTVGLCLEPLDVLFFRDGRPFGASTRAESGQPMPQTLAGALWTALLQKYGCNFRQLSQKVVQEGATFKAAFAELCGAGWIADVKVRGPWLAQRHNSNNIDVLTPMPAILHTAKKDGGEAPLHRLRPLPRGQEPPGWQPIEPGLRPLWIKRLESTEAAAGYLTSKGLQTFLNGDLPDRQEVVNNDALFGFDHRTGIEIAPDQLSAKEGGIYGISLLALRPAYTPPPEDGPRKELPQAILYAEVVLPSEAPGDAFVDLTALALGGEGRRVRVEVRPQPFDWPTVLAPGKPLLLLTTPGLFAEPWRPAALPVPPLVAAAVPGAVAVSGWDLARRGPKPTRFAAAPGSVYFLDGTPDGLPPDSLSDAPEDRQQGWGCYLKGVWTDA